MSGEANVRFIALPSPFHCTQRPVCVEKVGLANRNCHLDPAAWVLPGEFNAMNYYVRCNEGLAAMIIKHNVRFFPSSVPFTARSAPFV